MSYIMKLSHLISITQGTLVNGECEFEQLSTDTRKVQQGDVFLALSGDNFDGHNFCQQAVDKGAKALVVEREIALAVPQLIVKDCRIALGQIAAFNRNKFTGPVIGVTGSNGKTTTKELIAAILSVQGKTLATLGNLNNDIGVPLTLLRYTSEYEYSVIEMGANSQGEIAYCTRLARPDVAIITNAMGAHLEGFGSLQGVVEAKGEIFEGLSDQGVGIVNLDDANAWQWQAKLQGKTVLTFSLNNSEADVYASELVQLAAGNYQFTLNFVDSSQQPKVHHSKTVTLQLLALHNVKNALAAAASVFAIKGNIEDVVLGLESAQAVAGRLKQVPGLYGSSLIDDSYNGNTDSVKAGIDLLAKLSGETYLALGDMAELGADELALHRSVGTYAAAQKIDHLLSCGPKGRLAALEFAKLTGKKPMAFENKEQLIVALKERINSESKILIKGSLSAAMGQVVTELTAISGEGQ